MSDVLFPAALTLPVVNTGTAGPTGAIGMSGALLVVYNGSVWKVVTTN